RVFDQLKKAVISPPILQQADESLPFKIRTDASGYALGAVLLQGEGHEEKPIEYASRLMTPAERNYDTTQREALAVVWACHKFRGYIEGNEVEIASDRQPLRWLLSLKSPTGRLARWALALQSYNIKISYVPGKSNVIADTLSRPIHTEEDDNLCSLCTVSLQPPHHGSREIREKQLEDPNVRKIIECFEGPSETPDLANWLDRGYLMDNGILYRSQPDELEDGAQLVIPKEERQKILYEYHDKPEAGHYGTYHVSDLSEYRQPQNGPVPESVKLLRKRGRPPKKALLHGSGTDSCNSVSSRGGDCNTSTINLTRSGRRVRAPAFYE
ncbi:hypothetical protein ILUMI_14174, partial [Ignelater luminosus]